MFVCIYMWFSIILTKTSSMDCHRCLAGMQMKSELLLFSMHCVFGAHKYESCPVGAEFRAKFWV